MPSYTSLSELITDIAATVSGTLPSAHQLAAARRQLLAATSTRVTEAASALATNAISIEALDRLWAVQPMERN